ncbi:NAD(P)-binding protein [Nemania sp. NC0429]|nr:NAD(P)-binding protein [Nemania sp. NC0429]
MAVTRKRYALITGCGQGGIGEALAKTYMSRGISPIATVLPSEPSEHLSDANITWFHLDVTNETSIRDLKAKIIELTGGELDFLVNNAGICYTMPAADSDITAVQKMFNVNVFGPMRMVHHFHDTIIRAKGTIVNIGSIGGIVPYVYGSSYNATKAALHHWSSTLRVEMSPFDVKVLTIISGEVGTNFLKTDQDRELPKDSYYLPLATEFKAHVRRIPETTDRFVYAEKVVSKSLQSSPPAWFWFGHASFLIRLIDALAPRNFWDRILWGMFKFDALKQAHQKRRD